MWGELGTLGLRGWAGGDGGCQCWEFGPDWPISIWGDKITRGFHLNGSFSLVRKKVIWGCGVDLGPLGVAGGLVRGSAGSLGPIGRFRFGTQINTGFSFKRSWWCCPTGDHMSVFFRGSRPGRGARIPRADSTGEVGLLVGYGRCGCPGAGVGCAGTVPGVPGVNEYSR